MPAWLPSTLANVDVGTESTLVLEINTRARVRFIQPPPGRTVWLGLGVPAVVGEGVPIRAGRPWDERELLFRGPIFAVHDSGPGTTVPLLVVEGVSGPGGP